MLVVTFVFGVLFFFFKQKTAYEMRISDWSSDVCSSDLDRSAAISAAADAPAMPAPITRTSTRSTALPSGRHVLADLCRQLFRRGAVGEDVAGRSVRSQKVEEGGMVHGVVAALLLGLAVIEPVRLGGGGALLRRAGQADHAQVELADLLTTSLDR